MKNKIMIDIDSERENQIMFNKPDDFIMPEDLKGHKNLIINDLKTLCHGLGALVKVAEKKGLGTSNELLDEVNLILNVYRVKKINDESSE